MRQIGLISTRSLPESRTSTQIPIPIPPPETSNSIPLELSPLQASLPPRRFFSFDNPPPIDQAIQDFSFDDYDLPPLGIYGTRAEALAALNQWGLGKGYSFSNALSKNKGNSTLKAIFGCDRKSIKPTPGPMKEKGEGYNKGLSGTGYKFSVICR